MNPVYRTLPWKIVKQTLFVVVLSAFTSMSAVHSAPINIVTFNAENLFDFEDDAANPRDDTYLPLKVKKARGKAHSRICEKFNSGFYLRQCLELDWNESVYQAKLKAYADVVLSMPSVPDVLVIPETENKRVVDDLVNQHFVDHGYNVIQLDTSDEPDSRGIDVAILSKLPVIGQPIAHVVDFGRDTETCGATRDILEAKLELPDGDALTVFGVHFPSGSNPTRCRYRAFKQVSDLAATLPEGSLSLIAGDFNINCNETTSDAYDRLLQRGGWYGSPAVSQGCLAPGSSKYTDRLLDNWHTWSYLDQIVVSASLSVTQASSKNWFADLGSFQTLVFHPSQYSIDKDGKGFIQPQRFNPTNKTGVSDHWPVGLRLLPRRVVPDKGIE